ncbi:MAG: hypothetical protein QXL43_01005 [Methanolinea sp.]
MIPVTDYVTRKHTGESYFPLESLREIPTAIGGILPTMEKDLDEYFDRNFPAIVGEWGLVSTVHLREIERRIERVQRQIDFLEKNRERLEERASALEREIRRLEGQ